MSTATEIVVTPCTPSNVAALLEASADVVAARGYRPPSGTNNESGSAHAIGVTTAMVIVLDPEAATLDSDQFDIVMDWYMGCGDSPAGRTPTWSMRRGSRGGSMWMEAP